MKIETTAQDRIIDTLIANGMDYDEVYSTVNRLAELDAEVELWTELGDYQRLGDAYDELDDLTKWLGCDANDLLAALHEEIVAYNAAYAVC